MLPVTCKIGQRLKKMFGHFNFLHKKEQNTVNYHSLLVEIYDTHTDCSIHNVSAAVLSALLLVLFGIFSSFSRISNLTLYLSHRSRQKPAKESHSLLKLKRICVYQSRWVSQSALSQKYGHISQSKVISL